MANIYRLTVCSGNFRRLTLGGCYLSFVTGCMLLVLTSPANSQELYAYRSGKRGVVTITSKRPIGKDFWVFENKRPSFSGVRYRSTKNWRPLPRSSPYDPLFRELAAAYRLEPALVKAVAHVESGFVPRARSHKGASGLMQLMPQTARRFGVKNIYHPSDNVLGGVRYLRWLFNHFDGNVAYVLAGYNAGEGAVARHRGVPPYRETQDYVKRVLAMRDHYRCDYEGRRKCTNVARS